jgi:hypothetical protein
LWLETALEEGYEIPIPDDGRTFSGHILPRMPKSLHKAVAEEAASENVSINQYLNILITENGHIRAVSRSRGYTEELHGTAKELIRPAGCSRRPDILITLEI